MAAIDLKHLIKKQQQGLQYFFDHLDLKMLEDFVSQLAQSKGTLFFTGVGKSGFIAQKITASLVSMGIKAYFLSPMNALHGDLGIVKSEDVFICLSKSGESEEILNFIPFIRNRNVIIVAVISNKKSKLAQACDALIYLPMKEELCPFDMVPTISTEVQLLFGDLLAVSLMQKNELSLSEFAINHPGGKIGKRLSVRVKDLMLTGSHVPFCSPDQKLLDVLDELSKKRCGCLLVCDDQKKLLGIFTDGDLRRALQEHGPDIFNQKIKAFISSQPKIISSKALAWEALQLMEADHKRPIMVLPVLNDEGCVEGLVKMHDILQAGIAS